MSDPNDIVQVFGECSYTLKQLHEQQQIIEHNKGMTCKGVAWFKHASALKKAFAYLEGAHQQAIAAQSGHLHEIIDVNDNFTWELSRKPDTIRRVARNMLGGMIEILEMVIAYLMEDMSVADIHRVAITNKPNLIRAMYDACEQGMKLSIKQIDDITDVYKRKLNMSRDNLQAELVAAEYQKNKRLNKFEQSTNQVIVERIVRNMAVAWTEHRETVSHLESSIDMLQHQNDRWKEKTATIHSYIDRSIMGTEARHNQVEDDTRSEVVIEPRIASDTEPAKAIDHDNETSCQASGAERILTTDPLLLTTTTTLNQLSLRSPKKTKSKHSQNHNVIPSVLTTSVTPSVPHSDHENLPDNNVPSGSQKQMLSTNSPAHSTKPKQPLYPSDNYSYEHNKENIATPSPPIKNKETWNMAFAGLDKYARDVFARSPSASSVTTK